LIRQSPHINENEESGDEFPMAYAVSIEDSLGNQQQTNVYYAKDIICLHKQCKSDPKTGEFYRKKNNKRSKHIFYCRAHRLQNTTDFFDLDPVVVIDAKR
jgi:hypothetical protein